MSERGFKRRTIERIIKDKQDDWLKVVKRDKNLKDEVKEELVDAIRNQTILTGGAITSMLLGEQPNDFDFYFKTPKAAKVVATYYLNKTIKSDLVPRVEIVESESGIKIYIKSMGIQSEEEESKNNEVAIAELATEVRDSDHIYSDDDTDSLEGDYQYFEMDSVGEDTENFFMRFDANIKNSDKRSYRPILITSNAITLNKDVQIITRFTGSPEEIHKNYDFVHCTNYWTREEGLVLRPEAMEATLAKELRYVGSRYPIASLFRVRKFIERGWSITAGTMLKIAWDVHNLELNSVATLEDQLVGVDAAFFHEVLAILKKNKDKCIDRTYLFEIISRVFD